MRGSGSRASPTCSSTNDRPIHIRCDDSVTRLVAGAELPLRRSRGEAPQPLDLPVPCRRPTLALGGQLKATFALGRGRHAFLSHHIGDLDHYEAYRAYVAAIEHYERLFAIRPERIVHDLHPDYASTRYAERRDAERSRASPCSTTMRTSRVAWPTTASTSRSSAWRSTAPGSGPTGRSGGASSCRGLPRLPSRGPPPLRRDARRRAGHPRALADGHGPPARRGAGRRAVAGPRVRRGAAVARR